MQGRLLAGLTYLSVLSHTRDIMKVMIDHRVCTEDGCGRPLWGRGYCNMHYYRLIRKPKTEQRMADCAWCGERKPLSLIRHPNSSRGKTPSTCQACRDSHPGEAWCDFHGRPHPRGHFTPRPDRPIGVDNTCIKAQSFKASQVRDLPPIACASCRTFQPSWNFRGGGRKSPNCRSCEAAHADRRWCVGCSEWVPTTMFARTRVDGKFWTIRCRPCRTAHVHGVTVAFILDKQGSSVPECACCKSQDFLKIDHDHDCCPTATGCKRCVRGYLCHECNTAEGLLRTADRARLLASYMERVGMTA